MHFGKLMSNVEIKVFYECDWEIYKSLRLESLIDSPDSFGSTLEREAMFSEDEWKTLINASGNPAHTLPIFAVLNDSPIGLALGLVDNSDSNFGHIYQMWVSPRHRGTGIGRALLTRIVSWSKELELSSLELAVTTSNSEAISLYESFGFITNGQMESLREGSSLITQQMIFRVGGSNA